MSVSTAASAGRARNGCNCVSCSALRGPCSPDTALVSPPVPSERTLRLAAIGTLAGVFSGLFGVGGGTVIVPLLILWFGFGERLATGTSLA
ncbi:MAG TPA: sulfite exporter TauE/SafE family protein, partial [Solirubrobacterales bacterium]|nr:sulfite exporter TauE/SafE family protein [Solirubrobacterales bacterium]